MLCCILFSTSTFAQISVFIKAIDKNNSQLNGESTVKGHSQEIEALAYSNGMSLCPTCSKADLQDFSFTTYLSTATIQAKEILLKGEYLKSVDIFMKKDNSNFVFQKIRMENVTITSISEGGSGGESRFTVNFTFAPTKIAWQYTQTTASGTPGTKSTTGWDFETNLPWVYPF